MSSQKSDSSLKVANICDSRALWIPILFPKSKGFFMYLVNPLIAGMGTLVREQEIKGIPSAPDD